MADKKYIDQAGLQKAFALIAGKYETIANFNALTALVGAAAKGSEEAKSILDRVAALETLAGETSVAAQIEAAVAAEAEIARAAEEAAQDAADAAQADVDALETLVGTIPEGATATTVVAYAKEVADAAAADASAVAELVGEATDTKDDATVFGAIAKEADRADTAEKALAGRLDVIEGEEAGSIKAAVAAEATRIDGVIGTWTAGETAGTGLRKEIEEKVSEINGAAEALEGRVGDLEDAVEVINGDAETDGSIAKALADAKAYSDAAEARLLGSDELAESLDSIKDIVDYISKSDDKEGVTNLFEMVTANGAAITAEAERAAAAEQANAAAIAAFVPLTDDEITAAFNA